MLPRKRHAERIPTLIAGLHGVCNPPEYACGYWTAAAAERGLLVCPTGNARCSAASYHAPTWTEPETLMDADLEAAIAATAARFPALVAPVEERRGAVLFGFSKGAYAAVRIAQAHPGRWPYLVLVEADVALEPSALRAAGVRAVALLAGEFSPSHRSERRTAAALERAGFPARLWVMPHAGHYYSPDIDTLMAEALDFVLGVKTDAPAPADRPQAG
jgi:pimeloyl-ACP methyl ester carboxylesterase